MNYTNSLFKSLLKEEEINYGFLYFSNNSSLSILILNIIYYKIFSLYKHKSFEENYNLKDLFYF